MSLYVNTTLIGIIAFIMIFTYTAESIVFVSYDDYDSSLDINKYNDMTVTGTSVLNFNNWLNEMYVYAEFWSFTPPNAQHNSSIPQSERDFAQYVFLCYYVDNALFDKYPTGVEFYNALPVKYYITSFFSGDMDKEHFDILYNSYINTEGYEIDDNGVLTPIQEDLLGSAMDFLGKIPDFFNRLMDLFTFQIKDNYGVNMLPNELIIIMNMFFIPMWIILSIEILPIIAKLIEAIGSLIPF